MVALAMMEGFKHIAIYGVDMATDCIAPDSHVLTADLRWMRAGDLTVGQKILAFDEHPGTQMGLGYSMRQWRKAIIENVQHIKRPCYRINLSDGISVVASEGHQWLTEAENTHRWKRTDQLVTSAHREGRPTRIVKLLDTWEEDNTREGGYLAAAFDGEGHVSQHGRKHNNGVSFQVGFAQKDNAMLRQVLKLLDGRYAISDSRCEKNETHKFTIGGGRSEILRFLGEIRPQRLLENFVPDKLGTMQRKDTVAVESLEFVGEQDVIGLRTSTQTTIVEGLASHNSEYGHQKPSCEYLIGLAEGMGIKVEIPDSSELLKCAQLYGFESNNKLRAWMKAQTQEMGKRVQGIGQQAVQLQQNLTQAQIAQAQCQGAQQAYKEILKRTQ
jgi:hypothetical protein